MNEISLDPKGNVLAFREMAFVFAKEKMLRAMFSSLGNDNEYYALNESQSTFTAKVDKGFIYVLIESVLSNVIKYLYIQYIIS